MLAIASHFPFHFADDYFVCCHLCVLASVCVCEHRYGALSECNSGVHCIPGMIKRATMASDKKKNNTKINGQNRKMNA